MIFFVPACSFGGCRTTNLSGSHEHRSVPNHKRSTGWPPYHSNGYSPSPRTPELNGVAGRSTQARSECVESLSASQPPSHLMNQTLHSHHLPLHYLIRPILGQASSYPNPAPLFISFLQCKIIIIVIIFYSYLNSFLFISTDLLSYAFM